MQLGESSKAHAWKVWCGTGALFHGVHQKVSNGLIDAVPRNALALSVEDLVCIFTPHTPVVGKQAALAGMVEDRHSSSTAPADHQTLQQRRTFPWRALAVSHSPGLRVFLQAPQVLFVFLPGDISWVSVQD